MKKIVVGDTSVTITADRLAMYTVALISHNEGIISTEQCVTWDEALHRFTKFIIGEIAPSADDPYRFERRNFAL